MSIYIVQMINQEKFEDNKEVIRSRKSKKERQYNYQKKKNKQYTLHRKLTIHQHEPH